MYGRDLADGTFKHKSYKIIYMCMSISIFSILISILFYYFIITLHSILFLRHKHFISRVCHFSMLLSGYLAIIMIISVEDVYTNSIIIHLRNTDIMVKLSSSTF